MTALLDDFNRANSANLGANWALVPSVAAGGPSIASNQAKIGNTPTAGAWTPNTYGADQELEYTIRTVDGAGTHSYLLAQMPDPAMATFTGYVLDFEYTSSSVMNVVLYRGNAGSFTTLHTTTGVSYATGDVFSFRKVGADITALKNGVAISGFPITDTSPLSATGTYIGFGGYNATTLTFDDFSGPATATTYFGAVSVDLTDSVTTSGVRTTFGSSTVDLVDTITTSGVRGTFGSVSTDIHVAISTTPLADSTPVPPLVGHIEYMTAGGIERGQPGTISRTKVGA